jgi:hypothetical protein
VCELTLLLLRASSASASIGSDPPRLVGSPHVSRLTGAGLTRVQQLAHSLLPPRRPRMPNLGDLRYQLLTATAGMFGDYEVRGL